MTSNKLPNSKIDSQQVIGGRQVAEKHGTTCSECMGWEGCGVQKQKSFFQLVEQPRLLID